MYLDDRTYNTAVAEQTTWLLHITSWNFKILVIGNHIDAKCLFSTFMFKLSCGVMYYNISNKPSFTVWPFTNILFLFCMLCNWRWSLDKLRLSNDSVLVRTKIFSPLILCMDFFPVHLCLLTCHIKDSYLLWICYLLMSDDPRAWSMGQQYVFEIFCAMWYFNFTGEISFTELQVLFSPSGCRFWVATTPSLSHVQEEGNCTLSLGELMLQNT